MTIEIQALNNLIRYSILFIYATLAFVMAKNIKNNLMMINGHILHSQNVGIQELIDAL